MFEKIFYRLRFVKNEMLFLQDVKNTISTPVQLLMIARNIAKGNSAMENFSTNGDFAIGI